MDGAESDAAILVETLADSEWLPLEDPRGPEQTDELTGQTDERAGLQNQNQQ